MCVMNKYLLKTSLRVQRLFFKPCNKEETALWVNSKLAQTKKENEKEKSEMSIEIPFKSGMTFRAMSYQEKDVTREKKEQKRK